MCVRGGEKCHVGGDFTVAAMLLFPIWVIAIIAKRSRFWQLTAAWVIAAMLLGTWAVYSSYREDRRWRRRAAEALAGDRAIEVHVRSDECIEFGDAGATSALLFGLGDSALLLYPGADR